MRNTGALKVTTPSDRETVMARVFDAPRGVVFDAWTSPEQLPRWMSGPEAGRCPSAMWTSALAGAGTSSGASPTGPRWRCAACTGRSRRLSGSSPPSHGGGDWPETINTLILSETDGRTSAPSPLSPFPEPGLPYVPVPPPSPGLSWWVRYATLPP